MPSHSSALVAGLVVCLSAAAVLVAMPWLAAAVAVGEGSISGPDCQASCGGMDIPFPFGMGPHHCWLPGFEISCKDTGNGVLKPFMVTQVDPTKPKDAIVEILNISLDQAQAKVLNPISSYCYDAASRKMVRSVWNWGLGSYSFSSTANKFTVVGCRALAYIGDTRRTTDASAKYQTGCVSVCFGGRMSLNPCSGMGCCQTTIPKGLRYYQFFNSSRGGKAPVVLDWSIGEDNCTTAAIRNPAAYACRSINSSCYGAASGRGYICKCNQGFDGNPYLPDGCQDIDECQHGDKYPCYGECMNTNGSFTCQCPAGTRGNASDGECHEDPFPPGTRVVAVITK